MGIKVGKMEADVLLLSLPQKLEFLHSGSSAPSSQASSPYLTELTRLFGSNDVTNDEIFDWIEVCVLHGRFCRDS